MNINISNAKPFVKWVGGKTGITPIIERMLPGNINSGEIDYVEPFVGGGGFLYHMLTYHTFHKVYIKDINTALINSYQMFQNDILYNEFIEELLYLEKIYNNANDILEKEKIYYDLRDKFREMSKNIQPPSPEFGALFVFLNKTCFNGVYRTNKKGIYNVPWGKKTQIKLYEKNIFESDKSLLYNVIATNDDFETIMSKFKGNKVLMYLDPPYASVKKDSFSSYSPLGFTFNDQKRLRDMCNNLTSKGVKIIESNSDTPEIRKLYKKYNIKEISAPRSVGANGESRGQVTELLITNF